MITSFNIGDRVTIERNLDKEYNIYVNGKLEITYDEYGSRLFYRFQNRWFGLFWLFYTWVRGPITFVHTGMPISDATKVMIIQEVFDLLVETNDPVYVKFIQEGHQISYIVDVVKT